jgi:hypothetical protein
LLNKSKEKMQKILLASLLCLSSLSASALDVVGVNVPEQVQSGDQSLVLNGAGAKKMAGIFNVYVIALYLPEKKHSIDEILAESVSKRLVLNFMYDGQSAQLLDATRKLLVENHSEEEFKKLDTGWKEFAAPFDTLKDIKKDDQMAFDFNPKTGIKMSMNGKEFGQVEAAGFMRAFLKVWLGNRPAQVDLKDKLLGLNATDVKQ